MEKGRRQVREMITASNTPGNSDRRSEVATSSNGKISFPNVEHVMRDASQEAYNQMNKQVNIVCYDEDLQEESVVDDCSDEMGFTVSNQTVSSRNKMRTHSVRTDSEADFDLTPLDNVGPGTMPSKNSGMTMNPRMEASQAFATH